MSDYNHTDIGSGYNTKTAINSELSAVETVRRSLEIAEDPAMSQRFTNGQ